MSHRHQKRQIWQEEKKGKRGKINKQKGKMNEIMKEVIIIIITILKLYIQKYELLKENIWKKLTKLTKLKQTRKKREKRKQQKTKKEKEKIGGECKKMLEEFLENLERTILEMIKERISRMREGKIKKTLGEYFPRENPE